MRIDDEAHRRRELTGLNMDSEICELFKTSDQRIKASEASSSIT